MPSTTAPHPIRTSPREVVEDFLRALETGDVDRAVSLLDDDVVYTNVSLPSIRGARAVARVMAPLSRSRRASVTLHVHRVAADGPVVLTERTDVLAYGPLRAQFWVCGAFEVHDGRITEWRDYFDWANVTAAFVRGVVGALVPPLRKPELAR